MITNNKSYLNSMKIAFFGTLQFIAFFATMMFLFGGVFVFPIALISTTPIWSEAVLFLIPYYVILFFIHTTLLHFNFYNWLAR